MNLYNNAFYSLAGKKIKKGNSYKPVLEVRTKKIVKSLKYPSGTMALALPMKSAGKYFNPSLPQSPQVRGRDWDYHWPMISSSNSTEDPFRLIQRPMIMLDS
jgi:hypothetical protein